MCSSISTMRSAKAHRRRRWLAASCITRASRARLVGLNDSGWAGDAPYDNPSRRQPGRKLGGYGLANSPRRMNGQLSRGLRIELIAASRSANHPSWGRVSTSNDKYPSAQRCDILLFTLPLLS